MLFVVLSSPPRGTLRMMDVKNQAVLFSELDKDDTRDSVVEPAAATDDPPPQYSPALQRDVYFAGQTQTNAAKSTNVDEVAKQIFASQKLFL